MATRGNGSVTYDAKRARYQGRLELTPGPDGKRRRKRVYAPTEGEAWVKLEKLREELEDLGEDTTLARWVDRWVTDRLAHDVANGRIRLATAQGYESVIRRNVLPAPVTAAGMTLGQLMLREVKPEHVRAMHRWLSGERGLATRTVSQAHVTLYRVLRDACQDGLLRDNPAEHVATPTLNATAVETVQKPLTGTELRELLDHLATTNHQDRVLLTVLGTTGLRFGEAAALTWDDVDLDAGTLTVCWSVRRARGQGTGKGRGKGKRAKAGQSTWLVGPPKTKASRRTVPLRPDVVALLAEHKRQERERKLATKGWTDPEHGWLVFPNQRGGFLSHSSVHRRWELLCDDLDLGRRRIHDLRGTVASVMLDRGVAPALAAAILGHGDGGQLLAKRYAKADQGMAHQAALSALADALG